MRNRRGHVGAGAAARPADGEIAAVSLGRISAADYDVPREPLPSLHFDFEALQVSGALLRQLGAPPGWSETQAPAEKLGETVRAAGELARRLALGEADASDSGGPHNPERRR